MQQQQQQHPPQRLLTCMNIKDASTLFTNLYKEPSNDEKYGGGR
jgi:hypothetical protein